MKYLISIAIIVASVATVAQERKSLKDLSDNINNRIQQSQDLDLLSRSERRSLRNELIYLKDLLDDFGIYA